MNTAVRNPALPNVVLLGNDRSQYGVLRFILGEEYRNSFHEELLAVYVHYGDECRIESFSSEGTIWASSNLIPRHCILLFWGYLEPPSKAKVQKATQYLIVEGEAFGTESTNNLIDKIKKMSNGGLSSAGVLLFQRRMKLASTDLKEKVEPIQAAREKLAARGIPAFILREDDNPIDGTFSQALLADIPWDVTMFSRISEILDGFETRMRYFEDDYQTELLLGLEMDDVDGYFGKDRQMKLCSYRTVNHHKQDTIWESYLKELYGILFPENKSKGLGFALDYYSAFFDNIPGWPIEKERDCLQKKLADEMFRFMRKARKDMLKSAGRRENKHIPDSQDEYDRELSVGMDREINVEFQTKAHEFVAKKVPHILKERLIHHMKRLQAIRNSINQAEVNAYE